MNTRRSLPDAACDELWARINRKKYAYGFCRDRHFVDRCADIQQWLMNVMALRRLETAGVVVHDVLEGNLILMKQMFGGNEDGNRKDTACL